jgi:hypothetical protein
MCSRVWINSVRLFLERVRRDIDEVAAAHVPTAFPRQLGNDTVGANRNPSVSSAIGELPPGYVGNGKPGAKARLHRRVDFVKVLW